jgi:ornithine cyclodeaminase
VLETAWLKPGAHVNSVGPKFTGAHEMPLDIVEVCQVIATDSLAQATAYAKPFFIEDLDRVAGLDQIVAGRINGRRSENDITLFCSVGLAGTEVVLANELLRLKASNSDD